MNFMTVLILKLFYQYLFTRYPPIPLIVTICLKKRKEKTIVFDSVGEPWGSRYHGHNHSRQLNKEDSDQRVPK